MSARGCQALLEPVPEEGAWEHLYEQLAERPGTVILGSTLRDPRRGRYSFIAADPFLTFSSRGAHCEWQFQGGERSEFGNPWRVLERQLQRYEVLGDLDLPFPIGGCFGFCGYGMRSFVEPKLARKARPNTSIPDAWFGFHDSLFVHDHHLGRSWIVATGLDLDGNRDADRAAAQVEKWRGWIASTAREPAPAPSSLRPVSPTGFRSLTSRETFLGSVVRAQQYIRSGDIYQVNLSHQIVLDQPVPAWDLYGALSARSPAPYAAFLQMGHAQIVSSSPELFLRMSGDHVLTRPIKGTRPRGADPTRDAQLTYELQTSPKEMAELVMITDLLRNDLGRVCQFGSVQVPELVRLERFAQVQHLVSTVEGRLRPDETHFSALASMFPGGSVTGAPKFRAMEIIDELEPHDRGPYTGLAGYIGFNRESQMNILIRTATCADDQTSFHVGAGIVADSIPEAEYDETWAKARGFLDAIQNGCGIPAGVTPCEPIPHSAT